MRYSYKYSLLVYCAVLVHAEFAFGQSAAVPPSFQPLYGALDNSIGSFAATVDASWNKVPHPVDFAAELTSASAAALGERLVIAERYPGVLLELDSLKATGVKAINVQMAFPILYSGYYSSPAEYQKYIDFYQRLATDIRARGMKLIVRCGIVFSEQGFSTISAGAFYRSLTLEQYKAARVATAVAVLQQIRPDYFVILNEPDSEAIQSGKPELGSVTTSTDFLRSLVAAVRASGVQGVSIGAGLGTWTGRYEEFIQNFLSTGIDFLDLHVYAANRDFLPRLIRGADLSEAAGKRVAISEAWPQKTTDEELSAIPVHTLFARDPFSFWAPLDEKFLRALVSFSHYRKLLFFSPFWSQYLHTYLDYDAVSALSPAQIMSLVQTTSAEAIANGQFTSAGVAYARAIAVSPDATKPGTPAGLAAYPLSNNAIHLTWTASADNVGVAGYTVYRNGIPVGTTASLFWQDIGLAPTTTYAYTLAAYDVAGNTSPLTAVVNGRTTSVPDTTPPSVPGPVTGAAMSSVQIELNWGRSTDNVKVVGYKVFRNGVAVAQVTGTAYSDTGLMPATTYAYSVAGVDNSGNVSAHSAPVSVATAPRDTQPPSVPGDVSAIAGRDIVYLSWTASSDNVAVVAYHVFRNGVKIATPAVFAYQDTTVKASTSYTYQVLAADANGNLSGLSLPVTVTTPDTQPPSVPGAPAGTAVSTTQIRVSWPPSVDNVKIAGYRIFRNGSLVTSRLETQYVDNGLSASTAYTYTVVAVDSSGNESAPSPGCTVTTLAPDTLAPSAPAITAIAAMSTTQVNLAWSVSTDDRGVAGYSVFRDGVKIGSTVSATGFADTGLTPSTSYTYAVRAFDAAGNESAPSSPKTVNTLAPPDTTPPTTPIIESATAVSPTQIVLKWKASTDNKAVAGYYLYRNGAKAGAALGTAWMDSTLTASTSYSYTVVAVDTAGNTSTPSAPVSAATMAPPDRTAPSVPGNVQAAAVASNRVSVAWTASTDNVGVAGYKIFRNGKLIGVSGASPYTDQLVFPNSTYTYTVSAYDTVGNESAQSGASTIATPR
jgi:chitodextrinase